MSLMSSINMALRSANFLFFKLVGRRRGITMIEVLVTIAIATIIFAVGIVGYRKWVVGIRLTNDRDEMKSAILRTQQLATAAAKGTAWGVHLEADRYVMFSGDFYNENNASNQTWLLYGAQILNASSTFANGADGLGPDVVFAKFTGETYNTGTIALVSPASTSTLKFIHIAESGQIY